MKILLTPIFFIFASCSEDKHVQKQTPLPISSDWDTSFFAPLAGDEMIYRETLEFISPHETPPITPRKIQKKIDTRKQTYLGPEKIMGESYHRNAISYGDQFKEGILLQWDGKFLSLAGSFDKDGKPTVQPITIPIAQLDMTVGSYLQWPNETVAGSSSRVVAFEKVHVPAGSFDAYKISLKRGISARANLKTYWFAPKIGIVKEVSRQYSGGLLRSHNTIELVEIKKANPAI